MEWRLFVNVAVFPIIFAAMAGYFVCFWPGSRPARRTLSTVLFPAVFGLSLICGRFVYLNRQPASLLESSASIFFKNAISLPETLWRLGPGFHFCLLGIILIAIFTWRLAFGYSSLPLGLAETNYSTSEDAKSWPRLNFLIWVLIGPLFVLSATVTVIIMIPYFVSSRIPTYFQGAWFSRINSILEAAILLGFTLCVVGRNGRRKVRNSVRTTEPGVFFLAPAIPIGIALIISTGHYLFDRAQWATHSFGNNPPPQIGSYFNLPDPWLLLLFYAALSEEIVFRGLLQERFIQRYGLCRGMFLVGVVWAAFHFFSDPHSGESDLGVLMNLASRIFMCLSIGYVLGWLTLRSGSVLPAAFAHTFYNVLARSDFGPAFYGKGVVLVGLWAVLAYVLFCCWPVRVTDEPETDAAVPVPEIGL
jgi:membrane protease YdiL (CAAX protease family)